MQLRGTRAAYAPKLTIFFLLFSVALLGNVFISKASPQQKSYNNRIQHLIQNGGYIVTKNGKVAASLNPDILFIPASTFKVATALSAIETLGEDFRFSTYFYVNDQDDLYIKGKGDPFLVSEEIAEIFVSLKKKNVQKINNIYLDDSAFSVVSAPEGAGNSLNPYDAVNSALAANFNTVNLTVSPKGIISSAEQQTPTLPLMLELGKNLHQGTHRINITIQKENILRHVGELFRAFQNKNGISGTGNIVRKSVPGELLPLDTHFSSKKLTEVVEGLMLYSNNYITNQLFLTLGAKKYGYPASWVKGKKALSNFLTTQVNLDKNEVVVAEGSGLSRNNKITPAALLQVLDRLKPYARLLPLDKDRRIKSGTLKDVFCYAGYFVTDNRYDPFVLILNQPGNHRDTIIDMLEKIYRDAD